MLRKLILSALVIVILGGCAPSKKLADTNRHRLQAIYLEEEITIKNDLYYFGPGTAFFGAIGALSNLKPAEMLKKKTEENGIRIEKLVREAMIDALKISGKVKLCDTPDRALAKMKIKIRVYGFSVPNGLSRNLIPRLEVASELQNPKGQTIWATMKSVPMSNNGPVKPRPAKEVMADIDYIRSAWTESSKYVADQIIAEF